MPTKNIVDYLNSMSLKTTLFNGYDKEDVILKMHEMVKILTISASDAPADTAAKVPEETAEKTEKTEETEKTEKIRENTATEVQENTLSALLEISRLTEEIQLWRKRAEDAEGALEGAKHLLTEASLLQDELKSKYNDAMTAYTEEQSKRCRAESKAGELEDRLREAEIQLQQYEEWRIKFQGLFASVEKAKSELSTLLEVQAKRDTRHDD